MFNESDGWRLALQQSLHAPINRIDYQHHPISLYIDPKVPVIRETLRSHQRGLPETCPFSERSEGSHGDLRSLDRHTPRSTFSLFSGRDPERVPS